VCARWPRCAHPAPDRRPRAVGTRCGPSPSWLVSGSSSPWTRSRPWRSGQERRAVARRKREQLDRRSSGSRRNIGISARFAEGGAIIARVLAERRLPSRVVGTTCRLLPGRARARRTMRAIVVRVILPGMTGGEDSGGSRWLEPAGFRTGSCPACGDLAFFRNIGGQVVQACWGDGPGGPMSRRFILTGMAGTSANWRSVYIRRFSTLFDAFRRF